ncbi:MAG: universal stress protein [Jhaorihella sp.]
MAYKSLLTVLTDIKIADAPLAQMVALARSWDAHAEALCLGVDRTQTGYYYAGANAMILQETLSRATSEAAEILEHARKALGRTDIRWAAEDGVAQIADLGRHVAHRARFSDLVVLPRPYGPERGAEVEPIVEAALFEGRAPVLVVPDGHEPTIQPRTIIVGWNESVEALTAIRQALPFLMAADAVRIVVIDPPQHGPDRSDPGGLLSQMLSRHGVRCEIDVLGKTLTRVSDILNRHVTDTGADMIVMGAYGHSRFREAILGGATRNMLERAEVPVFMAH